MLFHLKIHAVKLCLEYLNTKRKRNSSFDDSMKTRYVNTTLFELKSKISLTIKFKSNEKNQIGFSSIINNHVFW